MEGDEPGVGGHFEGFDGAIGGLGDDAQVGGDGAGGLVMPGDGLDFVLAHDFGEARIGLDGDGVAGGRGVGWGAVDDGFADFVG